MDSRIRGFLLSPLCALAVLSGGMSVLAQESPKVAGTDVPAPKRTKMVMPVYPPEAQAEGIRGIVILDLTIDPQGHVSAVEVVHSIPALDDAAVIAVRGWEYEVTKVNGNPVSVRLTVPITFALKVPDVSREDGVPELRQGVVPAYPTELRDKSATVVAEVTLDSDGGVADALVTSGDSPWAEALLQALRTWKFAGGEAEAPLAFRVQARFVSGSKQQAGRVDLRLSNPRRGTVETKPQPAPAAAADTGASSTPSPAPAPEPQAPARPAEAPAVPATPPAPVSPPAGPGGVPAATANSSSSAQATAPATAATEPARPAPSPGAQQPPIETLSVPPPKAPAPPPENGVSAVRDVALSPGVPDLIKGRRPVVPPLARMAGVSGAVRVRFAVNAAGAVAVQDSEGPDTLKPAAQDAVASWAFRRASAERLHLLAVFDYKADGATATVSVVDQAQP